MFQDRNNIYLSSIVAFAFVFVQFSRCKFASQICTFNQNKFWLVQTALLFRTRVSLPVLLMLFYFIKQLSVSVCASRFLLVGLRGLEPPTSRLSGVRSNHLSYKPMSVSANGRRFRLPTPFGGDEENRTPDPLLARQVLSQLSYTPIFTGLRKFFHSFHFLKVHRKLLLRRSRYQSFLCLLSFSKERRLHPLN